MLMEYRSSLISHSQLEILEFIPEVIPLNDVDHWMEQNQGLYNCSNNVHNIQFPDMDTQQWEKIDVVVLKVLCNWTIDSLLAFCAHKMPPCPAQVFLGALTRLSIMPGQKILCGSFLWENDQMTHFNIGVERCDDQIILERWNPSYHLSNGDYLILPSTS